jgi:mono/diheme cytochrome c family protein
MTAAVAGCQRSPTQVELSRFAAARTPDGPRSKEIDALEAFQLFSGRQRNPNTGPITFREARAQNGKNLFFGPCLACHRDLIGGRENLMVDTDIERIVINAPRDGGFGATGTDAQGGIGTGQTALANDDSARADFAANALVWLGLARDDLFAANPLNEF